MTASGYIEYGIDLGTTNSCIARAVGSEVRVYPNNDQMSVTPSVVRLLKTGRIVTGKRAYNAIVDDTDNVALEFKRWMGQKSVKDFPASGRSMSAEALSAEILKALRDDAVRAEGRDVSASVVTVPAAFGALQCDATARACALAGLHQAPLLQEPIAAAIAFGVVAGARDQRWMVFDLGGGTLDIAVLSTRDGRLTVLEHRGNNLLGGKDIDRRIVESCFVPALSECFQLPDAVRNPVGFQRLMRRLLVHAEEAKIDLSSAEGLAVSVMDVGADERGKPIELEIPLLRAQVERASEPLIDQALRLAGEVLAGARIAGQDLDRVLLVGGPTQMPHLRAAIAARFGVKIDFSLDPMTVVARGAALYAATIERQGLTAQGRTSVGENVQPVPGVAECELLLAFEPVSARLASTVGGRLLKPGGRVTEIKLDAEGGYWSSGWCPVASGSFEVSVLLQEGKSSRFFIYGRDASGTLVDVTPDAFSIRHGLVVSAPPLPHTIGVEVAKPNGRAEIDPVFKRGTSLPAERSVRYRSDKPCTPGAAETSLAIKLWEGEEFSDAEANTWVGIAQIDALEVRRLIPEGSDIELTIRIDASRLITVEAFVPLLNQHFSKKVYVAQEGEKDYAQLATVLPQQARDYRARVEQIESAAAEASGGRGEAADEVRRVRAEIDELETAAEKTGSSGSQDPDQAKRAVESARAVRLNLARIEKALGVNPQQAMLLSEVTSASEGAHAVVDQFGSALEKKELQLLTKQLERTIAQADERALEKMRDAFISLKWRVLFAQDWWWREVFDAMKGPGHDFVSRAEANALFGQGDAAIRAGDGLRLREAVRELWKLQPKADVEQDQERAMRSGLRRY